MSSVKSFIPTWYSGRTNNARFALGDSFVLRPSCDCTFCSPYSSLCQSSSMFFSRGHPISVHPCCFISYSFIPSSAAFDFPLVPFFCINGCPGTLPQCNSAALRSLYLRSHFVHFTVHIDTYKSHTNPVPLDVHSFAEKMIGWSNHLARSHAHRMLARSMFVLFFFFVHRNPLFLSQPDLSAWHCRSPTMDISG